MLMNWRDSSLESVEIHTSFDASQEVQDTLVDTLVKYQRGWPRRNLDFSGAEVSDDATLLSHLFIVSHKAPDEGHHVFLGLDLRRNESVDVVPGRQKRRLETKAQAIEQILRATATLSIQCDFHCTIAWRFLADSVSSIVHLPLLTVSIPGTSFGQVNGVRFASTDENPHEYVTLDLIGEQDLRVLTHFVFSGILSSDILEGALERGKSLKDVFVNQKGSI